MSRFLPDWVWIALLVIAWGGCGFYLGDKHSNANWQAKQAVQERTAREALQAAQAKGDALSTELLLRTRQIDQLQQESHRAITQATTGRTCLDSAALRVLNHAPGLSLVPTPTGSAAAAYWAPASVAGDGASLANAYSTDTQTAQWAIDAGAQFETCRTRLDALIDWHMKEQPTP